jgi:hypothetical protein
METCAFHNIVWKRTKQHPALANHIWRMQFPASAVSCLCSLNYGLHTNAAWRVLYTDMLICIDNNLLLNTTRHNAHRSTTRPTTSTTSTTSTQKQR